VKPIALRGFEGFVCELCESRQHRRDARAAVVTENATLVPNDTAQILDADREIVDVDLEADPDDSVAQPQRDARTADPGRLGDAALAQQLEVDQLGHKR
jgi:hypothetical protein